MMMVRRLGQAQHWGLLLYLMTIILSYHQHQQVSKTNRPIRGQYPGHVICLDQSEARIVERDRNNFEEVTDRGEREGDLLRGKLWEPIRGQYSGHVTSLDQSEASIAWPGEAASGAD